MLRLSNITYGEDGEEDQDQPDLNEHSDDSSASEEELHLQEELENARLAAKYTVRDPFARKATPPPAQQLSQDRIPQGRISRDLAQELLPKNESAEELIADALLVDKDPSPSPEPSQEDLLAAQALNSVTAGAAAGRLTGTGERVEAVKQRLRDFLEAQRQNKTTRLLKQIWKSDWSIAAFIPMTICFYIMKHTGVAFWGVLFFMLAVSTVDAILSIFVIRLSFQQNKSNFYKTEDYERDRLRYRVLISITKAILYFAIGISCGWTAVLGAHIAWLFTSCERLRYVILRWSMEEYYPDLKRWSIFLLLKEFDIEPGIKQFNVVAIIGALIGLGITLVL